MVDVRDRLIAAMNSHDPAAVAACFAPDYRSTQPLHPSRGFAGRDQVLANWTSVFDGVPDFAAESVASSSGGDPLWTEMSWTGTHRDGTSFHMRGVIVIGVADDTITWARLYMEPVEDGGHDIEAAVRELYRAPHDHELGADRAAGLP